MNEQPSSDERLFDTIKRESGLSHSQIQIWTGQKVHPESPFCNMAFAIVIEGEIDPDRFQDAWRKTLSEEPTLRTAISEENGVPKVFLLEPATLKTAFLDYSTNPESEKAFKEFATKETKILFEFGKPQVRSVLVKLSPSRFGWYLNQHHLVTDASSTVLLFKSVSKNYANPTSEAPSRVPYLEIAQASAPNSDSANYWSLKKDSYTQRVNPIYSRTRNTNDTTSSRREIKLSSQESKAIRDIANEEPFQSFFPDISSYAVFSTVLASFLHRSSGQDQLAFDSPAGNRPSREAKNALGCFIEMFPLDFTFEPGDTFKTLGRKCMEEIGQFLRNATPGASAPNGSSSSNVVLNYFPLSFGNFAGIPTQSDWIHSGHIDGVYDFKLQVHDYNGTGCYTIQFDLSDSTFSKYDQTRIVAQFQTILRELVRDLDTSISSIDILTEEERQRTLGNYNKDSNVDLSTPPTVLDQISLQVAKSPENIALREGRQSYTYAQLWTRSENIAKGLVSKNVKRGDCVALLLPRSSDFVIAILATLRAGTAYIPIDLNYPKNRIDRILTDSQATCVIHSGMTTEFPLFNATLDELSQSVIGSIDLPTTNAQDLAYVIYTSGSTGQPKGVEISHEGLTDYISWAERNYVRGERWSFPLFTSVAFDLTVTSIFLPLISGGELIAYPQLHGSLDNGVIDVINDNAVDFLKLTPSHLSLLRQLDLSTSRVKCVVLGGENLTQSLANEISGQFGKPVELFNEYGPTEAVVGCMIHKHDPEYLGASVPIGKPADNVSIYLLNEEMIPVPEGTPGEIYIARKGLANGYRNDPKKTTASFLPSPFQVGQRIYKTGDLARFVSDGCLTYLGRLDTQIKLSGFRVELGEIESALAQHQKVRTVYVTTKKQKSTSSAPAETAHCAKCGISSNYPSIVFSKEGVCSICSSYESIKEEAEGYFKNPDELKSLFESNRATKNTAYDCMVFFSGGKDSAYALCKLVDMGLKVYAFTLDNGYLSDQAMDNIRRVTTALKVEHEFATTPAMNEIFRDSLTRFSNVCNGCFKTIYTLGINRAHALGISTIVTGLSRGQFFETRLTENLFVNGRFSPENVDDAVAEARKIYHRTQDAVTRCLDVSLFESDTIFEEIQFVDFYRYWSAPLEEIYRYLDGRVPWIRPSDTGRSTNCLVNDVGIYIHQKERGFHNYALPYSWDVRLDQKERDEAKEELNDSYDLTEVKKMISEIGYDENRLVSDTPRSELVAYYESDEPISPSEMIAAADKELPVQMRPTRFIQVKAMPLTSNGKIDTNALPQIAAVEAEQNRLFQQPEGEVQEHVFEVWAKYLGTRSFGTTDSFFQIGGVSLAAMEITLQLCNDFEIDLPLQSIFKFPTVIELSAMIEGKILEEIEKLTEEEAEEQLNQNK